MRRGCWLQGDNTSIRVGTLGITHGLGVSPTHHPRMLEDIRAFGCAKQEMPHRTDGYLYLRDRTSLRVSRSPCFYTPLLFSGGAVGLLSWGRWKALLWRCQQRVSHTIIPPSKIYVQGPGFKVQAFQVMQRTYNTKPLDTKVYFPLGPSACADVKRPSESQHAFASRLVSVAHRASMVKGSIPSKGLGHNRYPLTWCARQRHNAYNS